MGDVVHTQYTCKAKADFIRPNPSLVVPSVKWWDTYWGGAAGGSRDQLARLSYSLNICKLARQVFIRGARTQTWEWGGGGYARGIRPPTKWEDDPVGGGIDTWPNKCNVANWFNMFGPLENTTARKCESDGTLRNGWVDYTWPSQLWDSLSAWGPEKILDLTVWLNCFCTTPSLCEKSSNPWVVFFSPFWSKNCITEILKIYKKAKCFQLIFWQRGNS